MWRYILIFVKTGAALKVLEGVPYRDKSTLLALVTPSGMAGTDGVVQDRESCFGLSLVCLNWDRVRMQKFEES